MSDSLFEYLLSCMAPGNDSYGHDEVLFLSTCNKRVHPFWTPLLKTITISPTEVLLANQLAKKKKGPFFFSFLFPAKKKGGGGEGHYHPKQTGI